MEIKKNEMDEKMEANTKDIIAGAYRFYETYYDKCLYIEGRMREVYPGFNWTAIIYKKGYGSFHSYKTNGYFFSCKINNDIISVFGTKL